MMLFDAILVWFVVGVIIFLFLQHISTKPLTISDYVIISITSLAINTVCSSVWLVLRSLLEVIVA